MFIRLFEASERKNIEINIKLCTESDNIPAEQKITTKIRSQLGLTLFVKQNRLHHHVSIKISISWK